MTELIGFNPIERATTFEKAIEIIPQADCEAGLGIVIHKLWQLFDPSEIVIIPILRGGFPMGASIRKSYRLKANPMRLNHYDINNIYITRGKLFKGTKDESDSGGRKG